MGKDKDWDIDPPGVRSVLIKTGEIAGQLKGEGETLKKLVERAAASAGTILGNDVHRDPCNTGMKAAGDAYAKELGPVAMALAAYFEARGDSLSYMASRASMSLNAATNATTHYVEGNLQMAALSQRNARPFLEF
ncbi:DUF6507 family protein [Streptomyces sp. XD-27]|uniref:DUF6507 family protein n=1 Tax=Streptomyces sp. XD-27 TaxID=3062779 RepID=UPI0026F4205D|nr:DUF6507 family protein [Streptomyces sp. XD-27]WKX71357.1 DUF6507 family protein [Streptomyces sp. XD-27]